MNYFLWINEAQVGPYPWEQIKALLAEKSVTPETLFWKEGMTGWQPLSTLLDPVAPPAPTEAEVQTRIFSGFWRRFGALVIDMLILCLAGHILGTIFFDAFCQLGSLGPLLGLGIALLYFGIQNSVLCGGQTPGKRLLGIAVVDAEGKLILPAHALVRYLILGLPFFGLSPALLGPVATSWTGIFLATAMMFWIGTITYLFLFNVPSRQSLHDRIVQTFVVRTRTQGAVTSPPFWTWHYVLISLIGFVMLGIAGAAVLLLRWGPLASQISIQQAVQAQPHVEYVSTTVGKSWSFSNAGSSETNSQNVVAFWHGKPDNMGEAARTIARTVLTQAPDELAQQDVLVIGITYGYDLGIASGSVGQTFRHTPQEWQQIVANASPP